MKHKADEILASAFLHGRDFGFVVQRHTCLLNPGFFLTKKQPTEKYLQAGG
jgi:hypothetical protein